MFTKNIIFESFKSRNTNRKVSFLLNKLLKENNEILNSLTKNYKNSYKKNLILRLKKYSKINLIGMGGSVLGSKAIYNFLKKKIKRKFQFLDNLETSKLNMSKSKDTLNIIISKSGNTLETISNSNMIIKKAKENIFITENKKSYFSELAKKLKSDIVHHNNFIGGRYSVLSEVGMLPAELMGLKAIKFKKFDLLIKNKKFINSLVHNVSSTLRFVKNKKFNSIILNYDENSSDFFSWYQQLVAESLGKKSKGILPIISNVPKDNHSLMQLYLDGFKNNFYTFFFVQDESSKKINKDILIKTHSYLKNKSLEKIKKAQYAATKKVFIKKGIPFRNFIIKRRNEETLGELFTFFILETILLGRALNVNPYDQPAVELIKDETKKFLINS